MISERAELIVEATPDATLAAAIRLVEEHPQLAPATLSPETTDLTRLTILGARLTLRLGARADARGTGLCLEVLSKFNEPTDDQIDRFLNVLYDLVLALPVRAIVLPGLATPMDRDAFFSAVSKTKRHGTASENDPRLTRGQRKSALQRDHAVTSAGARDALFNHDEHVHAYLAHLCAQQHRCAPNRIDLHPMAVRTRLSAWAASLSAAALFFPVALPVLIHTIRRGEDLRIASLTFAVAGLYSVLETNGLLTAVITL